MGTPPRTDPSNFFTCATSERRADAKKKNAERGKDKQDVN
jgi:hypothetical protein